MRPLPLVRLGKDWRPRAGGVSPRTLRLHPGLYGPCVLYGGSLSPASAGMLPGRCPGLSSGGCLERCSGGCRINPRSGYSRPGRFRKPGAAGCCGKRILQRAGILLLSRDFRSCLLVSSIDRENAPVPGAFPGACCFFAKTAFFAKTGRKRCEPAFPFRVSAAGTASSGPARQERFFKIPEHRK